jgi:hypothetical protein
MPLPNAPAAMLSSWASVVVVEEKTKSAVLFISILSLLAGAQEGRSITVSSG